MSALRKAQWQYDHAEPEPDAGAEEAEHVWVENGAVELLAGREVRFKRGPGPDQGVTLERFAVAVDEFVMGQLATAEIGNSVLGRLVLAAWGKVTCDAAAAAEEILNSPDSNETLREIARTLLRPLAADGLAAELEDAEL